MKKTLLLTFFVAMNSVAALAAFYLWDTSSLAAGSVAIVLFLAGGVGSLIGGHLAGKNLYLSARSHWLFALMASVVFFGVSLVPFLITHPSGENGPFPSHPWHEHGFTWNYLIISTAWMVTHATRTK